MIEREVFNVTANTDTTEGKGQTYNVARFSTKAVAEAFVKSDRYKRFAGMGHLSPDDVKYNVKPDRVAIFDTLEEYDAYQRSELVRTAKDKLTPEEYAALRACILQPCR